MLMLDGEQEKFFWNEKNNGHKEHKEIKKSNFLKHYQWHFILKK